jgi:hypothetical protein
MSASKFLKQFLIWDVLFGARTKKLAGINDSNNQIDEIVTMSDVDDSITFPGEVPKWFQVGEYFRIFGGANDSRLFRVKEIQFDKVITQESLVSDSGSRRMDARLWVVHNDTRISRPTSTGSTMFNVHNRDISPTPDDASAIALTFAEHYHDEEGIEDDKGIPISTEYNQLGYRNLIKADCCEDLYVDLGPTLVFDDEGNIVQEKIDSDTGVC